jgi:hypothetical protein
MRSVAEASKETVLPTGRLNGPTVTVHGAAPLHVLRTVPFREIMTEPMPSPSEAAAVICAVSVGRIELFDAERSIVGLSFEETVITFVALLYRSDCAFWIHAYTLCVVPTAPDRTSSYRQLCGFDEHVFVSAPSMLMTIFEAFSPTPSRTRMPAACPTLSCVCPSVRRIESFWGSETTCVDAFASMVPFALV